MQTRIYVTKTKKKEKSCVVIFFKQTPTHRERERERRKVLNMKGFVTTYQRTTHMINLLDIYKSI